MKGIQKRINKLVALFDSIKEDEHISLIERDLLLDYTRKLYDAILDEGGEQKKKSNKVPAIKHEESIEEKITVKKVDEPKTIDPLELKEEAPEVNIVPPVIKVDEPILTSIENYDVLFEVEEYNDLSSKLAKTKIADLNKAIGINERFFTIKELFNGEDTSYQSTLSKLHEFDEFDQARNYLSSSVIPNFGWADEDKVKKAQQFIKLVRRLYV